MRKVHSALDPLAVANLRNLLLQEGIETEVRTPFLAAASGDVPFTECWSQLWVVDDEDHDRAEELIRRALAPRAGAGRPWKCPDCRETVDSQFEACWRCGSARPPGRA
ncbi:MAG: DUF2007 domain-containing protein [Thermoanaerobaculia bacterium]